MNWTQIVLTLITMIGATVSAIFARGARTHSVQAAKSAEEAKVNSLRPQA